MSSLSLLSVFSWSLTEDLITFQPAIEQQRCFNSACARVTMERSVMGTARPPGYVAPTAVIILQTAFFWPPLTPVSKQCVIGNLDR